MEVHRAKGVCTQCGGPVWIEVGTDGDGLTIDYVKPCEKCLRQVAEYHSLPALASIAARPTRIANQPIHPLGLRTCPDCGKKTPRKRNQNRIARCESCYKEYRRKYARDYTMGRRHGRQGRDWRFAYCPACGERRNRKKGEHYVSRCKSCRNKHRRCTVEPSPMARNGGRPVRTGG